MQVRRNSGPRMVQICWGNLGARHWWRDNWIAGPPRGVGSGGAGGGRHGQITCFAPPALKPGPVHFCISIDGRTWACDQYQKSYYYYESMKKTQDKKIKSSFTSLPSGGEQLVISNMIVKSMARTEMKFICKFHLKRIRGVYDYTLRALRCLAPPGIDGTTVAVSVSINSQDFTYVGQLTYKSFDTNSNFALYTKWSDEWFYEYYTL